MQPTDKPASKTRVALTWVVMIVVLMILTGGAFLWVFFGLFNHDTTPTPPPDLGADLANSIFLLIVGGISAVGGVAGYATVIATNCFTFDFKQPVYKGLKAKLYLANIAVPMMLALAIGFFVAAFVTPLLTHAGLSPAMAYVAPLLTILLLSQVVQLWVLIWGPLEKRMVMKRLKTRGLNDAQLKTGVLIGISDAAKSSLKKVFGGIEDDIGMLWIGPQQLVYWGDNDQFALNRGDVAVERKADGASVTILSGVAHVILHANSPDGAGRQIRLHIEGVWTLGQQRRAMDAMAEAIHRWHSAPVVPPRIPASA
jgi:hypothetical protein